MPSLQEIQNMANQININNISNMGNLDASMLMQGQNGLGEINTQTDNGILQELTDSSGGVKTEQEQRVPWSVGDEWNYSLDNDYGNIPQLMDCMEYSIVGLCLSVRWTFWGPVYTTGVAVEHFVRDVHVEVLPQAPNDPIDEVPQGTVLPSSNSVSDDIMMMYPYWWKASKALADSLLTNSIQSNLAEAVGQTTQSLNNKFLYNDAQVSGNLERNVFDGFAGQVIGIAGYCQAPTLPGVPYFNSTLDQFSWRWLATSETILLALYQIKYLEFNDVGRSYGSTFPRSGYTNTNNRFKAAVETALRATNIAGENRGLFSGLAGLHIYVPLPQYASSSFTGQKYQTPQDAKSYKLDMVYPFKGDRCTRYGAEENRLTSMSLAKQRIDDDLTKEFSRSNPNNTAIFKLYRPFRCCRKNGSKVFDVVSPGPIGQPR
ncbi:hypothetical protein [Vibrio sp.]|uniref:hypothetical protein n=1 Tax=Vibrio sp. TaxID=678 RepID=UPI003D125893